MKKQIVDVSDKLGNTRRGALPSPQYAKINSNSNNKSASDKNTLCFLLAKNFYFSVL